MPGLNLQKKAVFIVALILFIIIAINTAVLTFVASSKYKSAILSKTSAVGESFQSELNKVLTFGIAIDGIEGVNEKLLEIVSRNDAVGYSMVIDATGRVLFHSDEQEVGKELTDKASQEAGASPEKLTQTIGDYYDLSFPLVDADDKILGALRIGIHTTVIRSQQYVLIFWALGISSVCFLIALVLVYFFISKFITHPIVTMEKAAEKVASGELTHSLELRGKDEIASLGGAINKMSFNIRDMISKIRTITDSVSHVTSNIVTSSQGLLKVADVQKETIGVTAESIDVLNSSIVSAAKSADSLSKSAEDTSSAMAQMKKATESVAESANVVDESAQETASSIEEMAANIRQIAESLESLSSSSESIATSIAEVNTTVNEIEVRATESAHLAESVTVNASDNGLNSVNAAMEGMENIRKSVSELTGVINGLGKRSEEIGKIVQVINEITDQTTLLSLNAAILAAQAGEHGKSFSVVADSIKSLAERTSASTKEIAGLIAAVQDETGSSVKMAAEGIRTVEKGLVLVKDVHKALSSIVESSQVSTEMSKAIQRATAEQSNVIKQITDSIKDMSDQVEHISLATQEQNKGSKFIIETTEKLKDISHQVKVATGEQQDGSVHIIQAIENITQQAEQIANDTRRQKQGSADIVQSMEKIQSTTEKLTGSSNDMSATINSLRAEAQNLLLELKKFKV